MDGTTFQQHPPVLANTDADTAVTAALPTPVLAQYVRITPTSWKDGISMRAGLVVQQGCADIN
eukprot:2648106-Rhodomonas_salina.1